MKPFFDDRGVVAIFALVFLVALSGVALGLANLFTDQTRVIGKDTADVKAFYLAEAGRARARYMLTTGAQTVPWPATGTFTDSPFGTDNGTYSVNAVYSPSTSTNILITSDGYFPNATSPKAHRTVTEKNVTGGGSGSTNLSRLPGVVATASSTRSTNVPSRAIDTSGTTYWQSNSNGNSWIRLNYGSAQTVSKVTITGSGLSPTIVQYSSTGVFPGTPVSSPTGTFNNAGGTKTFTAFTAQYIFLSIPTGNRPQVRDFQTYDASGLSIGTFATSG